MTKQHTDYLLQLLISLLGVPPKVPAVHRDGATREGQRPDGLHRDPPLQSRDRQAEDRQVTDGDLGATGAGTPGGHGTQVPSRSGH